MRKLTISLLDAFRLLSVIDASPLEWREFFRTFAFKEDKRCHLHDDVKLSLK